jgi:hypothetical protein
MISFVYLRALSGYGFFDAAASREGAKLENIPTNASVTSLTDGFRFVVRWSRPTSLKLAKLAILSANERPET